MIKISLKERRKFGQHFTSPVIFELYILPEIKHNLHNYVWVDLFAGSGNLILPILKTIPKKQRVDFFKDHIYLFDVQEQCIEETIKHAVSLGIPRDIAKKNIILNDSLRSFPKILSKSHLKFPIFHITNPPYLYLGYIVKSKETQKYISLFQGDNKGYQDLYQLALINDLRNNVKDMIYIIPSNFLFGNSVSNKIRDDLLKFYRIKNMYIIEKKIFKYTGTNVMITFFERKDEVKNEILEFKGVKIGEDKEIEKVKTYKLSPKYHYKAGFEFEDFIEKMKAKTPLKSSYYLKISEINSCLGSTNVNLIDSNDFNGSSYRKINFPVNQELFEKIKTNPLWIRTVDTGSWNGRAGLYSINEIFNVDGILVTKNTYRTNPIQIFFHTPITVDEQFLLKDYFNLILEYLRKITDSEFMTTYKYSGANYTRKYFGLSQAKKLIETFPIRVLNEAQLEKFKKLIKSKDSKSLLFFLKNNRN
ncbi:N-6 DNA methylase [Promethearchaeum syntrophicum]|uniref:N-6 DNA methylase n=1 Tax=Promethearchaeum syntrophicum TaxID=2594042 RepID=A0A5B9DBR9_9ARCH|nr:N-6 DNA methylase [Candidatus Prometheoarchaeum syntrophicum]QEE16116.1 N-6 DNA Methylase [Candidatus Prometheoarchaeum syntrophicum]